MTNNNFLLFVVFFFAQIGFSQQLPREILYGQILADSLAIENVLIMNSTTKKSTVSDSEGLFHIQAREKDTLIFSSLVFNPKSIVLTSGDFKMKLFRIKLEIAITNLDEVVITLRELTGILEIDQKNIKIVEVQKIDIRLALMGEFEDDEQSSPDNTLMPGYVNTSYMMDLSKIGQKLFRLFKKPTKEKEVVFVSDKIFAEVVRNKYSEVFFVDSLHLKKEEIGLFLNFCENEPDIRRLLEPRNEFELIDFLLEKSKQFKAIPKE